VVRKMATSCYGRISDNGSRVTFVISAVVHDPRNAEKITLDQRAPSRRDEALRSPIRDGPLALTGCDYEMFARRARRQN
jgi:hypothetical protein